MHRYGCQSRFTATDEAGRHHHSWGRHGGRHRGGRAGRFFDYGELRLLILSMLAERPRHGYELIKDVEETFGGAYSPSPGVIYPTLSWLDDMGYAAAEAEEGGRKRYRVTEEGEAFLAANRAAVDGLRARGREAGGGGRREVPAQVVRAMENLKLALRLRLRQGGLTPEAAEAIAATLDEAARTVERS
ncbi:PadR family transcriptional regulator [Phenylobacterium sp.]|uniref:PadR family transcriptional regulator n=1 Tax=Phenylobacterium sp. TaxID=1871053 RepID=UPI0035AFAA02